MARHMQKHIGEPGVEIPGKDVQQVTCGRIMLAKLYSAVQINMAKGCINYNHGHSTIEHVYLDR